MPSIHIMLPMAYVATGYRLTDLAVQHVVLFGIAHRRAARLPGADVANGAVCAAQALVPVDLQHAHHVAELHRVFCGALQEAGLTLCSTQQHGNAALAGALGSHCTGPCAAGASCIKSVQERMRK